jgi:hypothetical protein
MSWAASDHRILLRLHKCLRLRIPRKVDFEQKYVMHYFHIKINLNTSIIRHNYPIILDHQSKNDDWTL